METNTQRVNGTANTNDKLVEIVSTAIAIPGVKVNRNEFLLAQFKNETSEQQKRILEVGPIEAGCTREQIKTKAEKLLMSRTLASTGASFLTGLPGGLAMAAAIPTDMLQYYAVALRMAQEIIYLYGEPDLWNDDALNDELVRNQLLIYCGVMLGASGAAQTVRVLSSALSKQALKRIPQKALTKTIYYPIVKSICKFFGVHMTKGIFAKGVSKAVPVIGGIVSGSITFASMRPMGVRLIDTMDEAHFAYTHQNFVSDWKEIVDVCEASGEEVPPEFANVFQTESSVPADSPRHTGGAAAMMAEIRQAKELLDAGALTQDEFDQLKAKLISQLQ